MAKILESKPRGTLRLFTKLKEQEPTLASASTDSKSAVKKVPASTSDESSPSLWRFLIVALTPHRRLALSRRPRHPDVVIFHRGINSAISSGSARDHVELSCLHPPGRPRACQYFVSQCFLLWLSGHPVANPFFCHPLTSEPTRSEAIGTDDWSVSAVSPHRLRQFLPHSDKDRPASWPEVSRSIYTKF
jgi:hypothetical protein